ncbi:MAG: ribose 5-phosphate isomerase B [bacterium]
MKIALGADHRGYRLKEQLKRYLKRLGYDIIDKGPSSSDKVDYPDYAFVVAELVAKKKAARGVLICATGIGMSIAANKVPRIRAALCTTPELARLSREHNNANVLCLGADHLSYKKAKEIIRIWLTTSFAGGHHARRLRKIARREING